jgi:cob(I)alamin adenosyltransferase
MKIYTKTGDKGQTSLIGGKKVSKAHLKIESYGTVDELNSFIGLVRSRFIDDEKESERLVRVQNILFNIGAMLATEEGKENSYVPKLDETDIVFLENGIDRMDAILEPLQNFILPAGSDLIAYCHVCRTVCRRAERLVVALGETESLDIFIQKYLNRLSDYFFVLARYCASKQGIADVIWQK